MRNPVIVRRAYKAGYRWDVYTWHTARNRWEAEQTGCQGQYMWETDCKTRKEALAAYPSAMESDAEPTEADPYVEPIGGW